MRAFSAERSLRLPVRLQNIGLGRPVDLLLDPLEWRVLGFEVLCGDETSRFLPSAAASVGEGEIAAGSALMLLEDVEFYRTRGRSLRRLLGADVERHGMLLGTLADVLVGEGGAVVELVVDDRGVALPVAPDEVDAVLPRSSRTAAA